MTKIELTAKGARVQANVIGEITEGAVGIPVTIAFEGDAWEGAAPRFIALCGRVAKENVIDAGHTTVPHECLMAGQKLFLGLDGWNADGTVRIPTIWADCGKVKPSTAGVNPTNHQQPTQGLADQIYGLAYRANENVADLKRRADSGEFKGEPGRNGADGSDGADGYSAYQLAVQQGFQGTLDEWLASLKGEKGEPGDGGTGGSIPEDIDKIIEVTETQPTSPMNQAWVDPNSETCEVPSWEAFEALRDNLTTVATALVGAEEAAAMLADSASSLAESASNLNGVI